MKFKNNLDDYYDEYLSTPALLRKLKITSSIKYLKIPT